MADWSTRRLLRDLRLVLNEPIETVAALPLDSHVWEWHANIRAAEGPYEGTVLHLVLRFPSDYPSSPPTVKLCTHLAHPNVFGHGEHGFICLGEPG